MGWSQSVLSSNVSEVGYDDEAGELIVTFSNGSVYAYADVDEGTAIALSKAPSVGQMLNSEIKGQYAYRRVR
jgi:hypothetical protein